MKQEIFLVFDRASAVYAGPFVHKTIGEATRWFTDLAVSDQNAVGKHPEDYTLMYCGTFNDGTGQFDICAPEKVTNGLEAVASSRMADREAQLALVEGDGEQCVQ